MVHGSGLDKSVRTVLFFFVVKAARKDPWMVLPR